MKKEFEPAPKNSLPDWNECNLRVDNKKYMEDNGIADEGDSLLPNPIHEFIHEYDDADPYRSDWFMHRLEVLINFVKEDAVAKFKAKNGL